MEAKLQRLKYAVEAAHEYDAECIAGEYTDTGVLWELAAELCDAATAVVNAGEG